MSGIWWLINNETVTILRNSLLCMIARIDEDYPDQKERMQETSMLRSALHELDSGLHDNEGHIPAEFRPKVTDYIP